MYLIRGIGNLKAFKENFPNQTMSGTIGNFDGLHLGHQAILNQVKAKAKESSSASLVFFTEPHASEYFALEQEKISPPPRICPWREKVKLLKNFGIDFAFFLQFNGVFTKCCSARKKYKNSSLYLKISKNNAQIFRKHV